MVTLRMLLVGTVALGAGAAYAAVVPLAVKTGLWQVTVRSQMGGALAPAAALARMTPAQRARIQAAIAKANGPHTYKECITEAELRKGFEWANDRERRCIRTVVSSTAAGLVARFECKGAHSNATGNVRFDAVDAANIRAAIEITATTRGRTMTAKSSMAGRWLGSDCAGLKPGEMREVPAG